MFIKNILKLQKPRFLGFCFIALLGLSILSACEKDTETIDQYEATISISEKSLTVDAEEGSTARLIFSCDHEWTVEIPAEASWLQADKTSGESGKRIFVVFTAQANNGASRSATCVLKSGAASAKFTVSQAQVTLTLDESEIEDYERIYKPAEFNFDRKRSDSTWSFCRSKQSEHFIVFWSREYGDYGLYGEKMGVENTSPSTLASSHAMYVDIDDLLAKAEMFYDVNVNKLKFADVEGGKSNFCDYKIGIYLTYTTTWMAYGGGYDNFIGALWINPATCHPVGSTIAHEIGHSFQYQVYADQVRNGAPDDLSTGWRYEIGQGTGFWEQCAQWQAYQSYAEQAFSTVNFTEFTNNCHRHFLHEHQRYASYFLQWYWAEKHGVEVLGELWRESKAPEDPIETYAKKFSLTNDQLNAELYEYAAKCVTWDFDVETTNLYEGQMTGVTQSVRDFGKDYIGKIGWKSTKNETTGYYTVSPDKVPEATGFNHIRLNVPAAGTTVEVDFKSEIGAAGFNSVEASKAGWHCGFVALKHSGEREYSPAKRFTSDGTVSYTVPADCAKLWFVVAATPTEYMTHLWDEDNTNDEVMPYSVKFKGTDLFGNISFDGTETPHDITIEHDITTSAAAGYGGKAFTLDGDDLIELAKAFVMQPTEIIAKLPADRAQTGEIRFAAVLPDGSLSYGYNANGYGFWFDKDGSLASSWSLGYLYSEFAPATWTFQFGIHPDRVSKGDMHEGDVYTVKQAFVYGDTTATIVFNVTITA